MRLDKWLWAARFYKTRSLAQQAIAAGRVKLDGEAHQAGARLRVGDPDARLTRNQDQPYQSVIFNP